jgi:hypothetical protein
MTSADLALSCQNTTFSCARHREPQACALIIEGRLARLLPL